jgi:hypothetical protein
MNPPRLWIQGKIITKARRTGRSGDSGLRISPGVAEDHQCIRAEAYLPCRYVVVKSSHICLYLLKELIDSIEWIMYGAAYQSIKSDEARSS